MNENNKRELNLDEDQDIILSRENLSILKTNDKIMNMLKNKRLRKIIIEIDSTKFKKKTLEKMLKDSQFREFTDEILTTLGYLKNGSFSY